MNEALMEVTSILKKLRGDLPSPTEILADLRSAGCDLEPDGENLRVRGKLTDDQKANIRRHKPAILALLTTATEAPAPSTADHWIPEEADELAKLLLARLDKCGRPDDDAGGAAFDKCVNAVDAAHIDRDMGRFRVAVDQLIEFIDAQPKHLGKTTYYGKSPGPLVAAWVRTKFSKKQWLRIIGDIPKGQEEVLIDYVNDYMKAAGLSQCETKILDEGIDPNKRR